MGRFFKLSFLLAVIVSQIQAQEPGTVTERIVCDLNSEHSYALYLPSSYTPEKTWPVIFIYDAQGQGMPGIVRFKKAAEQYGYILVGSYNYRNGPVGRGFEAARILLEEITAKYPTDMNRLYTAGMSGGARMATTVAVVTGRISAVVAIGASFNFANKPSNKSQFDFIEIAGDRDMNYLEMERANTFMRNLGLFSHLIVYDGKHRWCEEPQATKAIEWLELLAMKKGLKTPNESVINALLQSGIDKAETHLANNELTAAEAQYHSLALLTKDWYKEALVSEALESLRNTKTFKKQSKVQSRLLNKEAARQGEVIRAFKKIDMVMRSDSVLSWWKGKTLSWRREQAKDKDPEVQKSATRILGIIGLTSVSQASTFMFSGNWEKALPYYKVAALINPDDQHVNYFMAKLYSLAGNKSQSRRHLKKALAAGFTKQDGTSDFTEEQLNNTDEFRWLTWRFINATF